MISHPLDIEYFAKYSAPLMEKMHSEHYSNINSTITFFGPMLYFLGRAIGAEKVLEIGHAAGYTAYYLAHAVKDNGTRYGMNNMYYGIDIIQHNYTKERLDKAGLPNTLYEMDSLNLPGELKDIKFDLIFQDGCHDTEHVLSEMEAMYPQLKPNGLWIYHDCAGPAEEGWHELTKLIDRGKYQFDYMRIITVYGLGILRKTEGIDPEKRYWYLKKD